MQNAEYHSDSNAGKSQHQTWSDLLKGAVEEPGILMKAYNAFHSYSLGNQIAAMMECCRRRIPIGPIDTYKGWQAKAWKYGDGGVI